MGFFRVIRNAPIVSIFIVLMLIFCAWFFLYDDSSPKAVKNMLKVSFQSLIISTKKRMKRKSYHRTMSLNKKLKKKELKNLVRVR